MSFQRARIVVNEAILQRGTSGSARATQLLTKALQELPGVQVDGVRPRMHRTRSSALNAMHDIWWDMLQADRRAGRADLLVSPCNVGYARHARRHLLVVYDVMVFENPEFFDPKFARYFRALVPLSLRRADRTLTLSQRARQALLRLAPSADVRVLTLPGSPTRHTRAHWPTKKIALVVGASEPHKNQRAAIEAVAALRKAYDEDIQLRLIGPAGRMEGALQKYIQEAESDRSWIRRECDITDDELRAAYASAWVLLQPSLNEGYGLPLVEASQHGLPVVHSGNGAMSEVLPDSSAGGAGAGDLVRALRPLRDQRIWEERSAKVAEESKRFGWDAFQRQVNQHVGDLLA